MIAAEDCFVHHFGNGSFSKLQPQESTILPTSYGSGNLVSAMVPADLYAKAGPHAVYLSNDFGESNRINFDVHSDNGV